MSANPLAPLDAIRVVLCHPTHPGNVGAVARAMGNMGVAQLVLVRPHDFPNAAADARAAGATHILQSARVVDTLDAALADCALVIGASARLRSIQWPQLSPVKAMHQAITCAQDAPVALLFGRESRGLTNAELDRCHFLVRIPVADDHPSLNLAAAAMVLLYELRKAAIAQSENDSQNDSQIEPAATAADMQHFYAHLQRLLGELDFTEQRSAAKLHRKLTKLFNRVRMSAQEVRMLRGILTAIEGKIGGGDG